MKPHVSTKKWVCTLVAVILFLGFSATAIPGAVDDPVVTLSYVQSKFLPAVRVKALTAAGALTPLLNKHTDELIAALKAPGDRKTALPLTTMLSAGRVLRQVSLTAVKPVTLTLDRFTFLSLKEGAVVTLLQGKAAVGGKSVLDATKAADTGTYAPLQVGHRYIALENDTTIQITKNNTTVTIIGNYTIDLPAPAEFRNICKALMQMKLINTEELERYTERQEMFVVILGINGVLKDAVDYGGTHPFSDVYWGDGIVAYLYDKKYTAGTTATTFSPDEPGTLQQMCVLILRSLGYIEGTEFTFATAMEDIVRLGLFSKEEIILLGADNFRRDDIMYMAFYTLQQTFRGTDITVLDRLIASGAITRQDAEAAMATVTQARVGW